MKYIIIVPDGMADEPLEELGGQTPLQAAHTVNMDYLAQHGTVGRVQTIPNGMAPGSDIGNMAILGYNPKTCHTGRAPLEAANLDIALEPDEIAVRCNLVTIEDHKMVDYSAGHISTKEADILIKSLNEQIDLENVWFYTGTGYRHILKLKVRNPAEYLQIKTVPPHDILGKEIKTYLPQGKEAEMFLKLMERSKEIFKDHDVNNVRIDLHENPANMIWLWGQGTKPKLPLFQEQYGLKGAMISAVDLVNGIGKCAGLTHINVPGITGYYDTDYQAKGDYALKALKDHDFVYVHIEAPDEAGHNGDFKEKITAIEQIDKLILGTILEKYGEHDEVRILVLPDHPTPVQKRTHTSDPVGFVMFGKGVPHDGSTAFHEQVADEKELIYESGEALMQAFIRQ